MSAAGCAPRSHRPRSLRDLPRSLPPCGGRRLRARHRLGSLTEAPHQVERFQVEVDATISRIVERRLLSPISYNGLRHVVTHVFPYQVWYLVVEDEEMIDVVAILHERQDRARLEDRR